MIRIVSFFLLTALTLPAGAQTDSLFEVLDTAQGNLKVKTLNELFRAYNESDPVKAIGYTREALSLATEIDDTKGMAASYNNLGVAYKAQGALDKALEYYIRSHKLYTTLDNKEGMATTKNNIASIYSIKGDYGQAMKYLEESYNQLVVLGDEKRLVGSLNNLGNLHLDLQLYDKANDFFTKAYQLSDKLGQPFSDPLNNMGNVFFKQGNYQRAIEYYQKALTLERAENNKSSILNTLTNIGIAFTRAKQPVPAMKHLEEAQALAKELQAYRFMPEIFRNMADNKFRTGDVKLAYKTLLRYDSAREKIHGEESSRNIAQMEIALSLQEKEREFDIIEKNLVIKTLELNNTRLFITLLVLVVLAILGGINFYYMGRKKQFLKK